MQVKKKFLFFLLLAVIFIFGGGATYASAAISENAPPMDGFFEYANSLGGGAIVKLAQFRLSQESGSDTLSQVGLIILASSTISQGEISRISLWKESGTNMGFQSEQDTFIAGAATTSPYLADDKQITLTPTSAVSIGTSPTEFYIIASTTAVTGITNGHGFSVKLQGGYASTTAGDSVGTAFESGRKIALNQTASLKISEVKVGATGNASDEFVEIYNTGEADINLLQMPLSLHSFYANGSSTPVALTYYSRVIPAHGFFLIGTGMGYNGSAPLDAVFATSSMNILIPNGGVAISTSTLGAFATSTAIDYLGWGTQPTGNCKGGTCASALTDNGASLERKALEASTNTTMYAGSDATKGNSYESNNSSTSFVSQTISAPQGSGSPKEFPYGGGMQDTSTLQVMGSFPGNSMIGAPIDISFVGFGFNKPVAGATISSASATTTVTLALTAGGPNLCGSVVYNPFPGNFEPPAKCVVSSSLAPNTSYTFTVSSDVYDLSGNALDQNPFQAGLQAYTAIFTTGGSSQTFTNMTPPSVVGTNPFSGAMNVPTNLNKVSVEFSQSNIDVTTLTSANVYLSGGITLSNFTFSTSTGKNTLTATLGSALAANTSYTLTVSTGVKNISGVYLPQAWTTNFTAGSGSDSSAPQIMGVLPSPGTTIPANTNDFMFTFDDNMDSTTITSSSVALSISGVTLPGTVKYDSVAKEGHFTPSNILPVGQALTLTLTGATIKNASDVALGGDVTRSWTVEAVNSDTTPPSILFANGDDFNLAITWNEGINPTDAINLSNYTLTIGGTAQTLSSFAGNQMSYDASQRTVKLSGVRLAAGSSFTITASNIKDISGNAMSSASSFTGTINSFSSSGGFVGPGSFQGSTFGEMKDFSASGIGFMPPVNVRPHSVMVNAVTAYEFELPIATQIPANGTILITFPSSADFNIGAIGTSSSNNPFINTQNKDINGPGTGLVGIKTIAKDTTSKTVTLTLDTATRSENSDTHDFLKFALVNLKNPSIPKGFDSSGYALDIKSKNASGTLLESFTANPIYITGGSLGGGATTTIKGTISGNGGVLAGVTVHLMSPQTGPMEATSSATGIYQFQNIPINTQFLQNNFGGGSEYYLATDPFITGISDANGATTTSFFGQPQPTPVQATSTSIIGKNFSLTATTGSANFAVKVTASAEVFASDEQVDIFAGGPGQFIVQTVSPGAGARTASTLATLPIPAVNGMWNIGMGPAMPKGGGFNGPPPSTNWSAPKPIMVVVSGCPSACVTAVDGATAASYTFAISTADKTISGILKDGSGNTISGAEVYAFSPMGGVGNRSLTTAGGLFSIKVGSGSYIVGAFNPGMGRSKEVTAVVDSSGSVYWEGSGTATPAGTYVLKMSKPAYTITGRVTDGTNAVGNAGIFAWRTDAPGHIDAMSDSSTGNYTLYVDNGTWKVNAAIPGFGPMSEQTVTVNGANTSNINFAPSSSQSFSILSGNLYESANATFDAGEGVSGAVIRLSGSSGTNETVSGTDGAYSLRVPSGAGYSISDIFHPTYGRIAPLKSDLSAIGTLNLTASTTQNIRIAAKRTITVNVKDGSGNMIILPKVFIDLFDTTTKMGNHTEITNASSTTLFVPNGATPAIRAFVQGVPSSLISVSSDDAGTDVTNGVLTVDGNEIIKITVGAGSADLSSVSGKIYFTSATDGNELADAWVQFIDDARGIHAGTQATSTGIYFLKLANGTYDAIVSKPGYVGTPSQVTITEATSSLNFILSPSSLTITGNVTAGGAAAKNAFVRAEKIGGGQVIDKTDLSGNYTLHVTSGTWRVYAAAEGYAVGASASNPVTVTASQSGINIALSTTVSLQSKLATSNTFTDTAASSFSDSTVGVKVDLDGSTVGTAGSSAYLTANETSNIPETASVNIIGNKAKDINAYSGGSQVKNLQAGKTATVELSYTKAELTASGITATTSVGNLKVVSYSEDKQEWESLSTSPTYKDADGNAVASPALDLSDVSSVSFTAIGTHFSAYALSDPSGVEPPATPTGVSASSGAAGTGLIAVNWNAMSGATGYYIYRDTSPTGSFPLFVDAGNVITYSNTGLSAGTYYYKVSSYKSGGATESAASSAVNAVLAAAPATPPLGGGSPGGGGSGTTLPANPTTIQTATPQGGAVIALSLSGGENANLIVPANLLSSDTAFKIISLGKMSIALPAGYTRVGSLYEISATAPSTTSSGAIYAVSEFSSPLRLRLKYLSEDLPSGGNESKLKIFFKENSGSAWQEIPGSAVDLINKIVTASVSKIYQFAVVSTEKEGTVSASSPAIPSVAGTVKSSPESSLPGKSAGHASLVSVIARSLKIGVSGEDVRALQTLLALDPEVYPDGTISGYFGKLTDKAVKAFQKKYGISAIGIVGPATRAKLKEIFGEKGISEKAPAVSPSPKAKALKKSLSIKMKGEDVETLQTFLAKYPELYPEGLVTGYFGELTRKAVMKFQAKYGFEQVGNVGPLTRAKINELLGE